MAKSLDDAAATVDTYLAQLGVDGDLSAEGFWTARCGSTVVLLSALEHDGRHYLRIAAIVLVGGRTSLDLLTRLLRLNAEALFGAFQLFDDQTVAFTHTIPLDGLSLDHFETALRYVARVADDHDEALQALAGGERAEDLLDPQRTPA